MFNPRHRALVLAAGALALIWALALGGFALARRSKQTAAKVQAQLETLDLRQLSGHSRQKALADLADRLNRLSYEERQRFRMNGAWQSLFQEMTDAEKGAFIEATLPAGFKQMITAFEQMPADKRKRAVEGAVKRLKEAETRLRQGGDPSGPFAAGGTNRPPPLSEDLQKTVTTIGLKSFYSESSAQTKAEMAPFLEELQRAMESGAVFRRPH